MQYSSLSGTVNENVNASKKKKIEIIWYRDQIVGLVFNGWILMIGGQLVKISQYYPLSVQTEQT